MANQPIEGYWLKIGSKTKEELSIKIDKSPKENPPPREKYFLKIGSNSTEELSMTVSKNKLPQENERSEYSDITKSNVRNSWTASNTNISSLKSRTPKRYQRSKTIEQCSIEISKNVNNDPISPLKLNRYRPISDSHSNSSINICKNQGSSQSLDKSQPSTSSFRSAQSIKKSFKPPLNVKDLHTIENVTSETDLHSNAEIIVKEVDDSANLYENASSLESQRLHDSQTHLYENDLRNSSSFDSPINSEHNYENITAALENSPERQINSDRSGNIHPRSKFKPCTSEKITSNNLNLESVEETNIISENHSTLELLIHSNDTSNAIYNQNQPLTTEEIRDLTILEQFQQSICGENVQSTLGSHSFTESTSSINSQSDAFLTRELSEGRIEDENLSLNESTTSSDQHSISKCKKNKTIKQCIITVNKSSNVKTVANKSHIPKQKAVESCTITVLSNNNKKDSLSDNAETDKNISASTSQRKIVEKCVITESKHSNLTENKIVGKDSPTERQKKGFEVCSVTVKKNVSPKNIDEANSTLYTIINNSISDTNIEIDNKESGVRSKRYTNSNKICTDSDKIEEIQAETIETDTSKQKNKTKKECPKTIENCNIIVTRQPSSFPLKSQKCHMENCSIKTAQHPMVKKLPLQQKENKTVEKCSIFVKKHSGTSPQFSRISIPKENILHNSEETEAKGKKEFKTIPIQPAVFAESTQNIQPCTSSARIEVENFNKIYPTLENLEERILESANEGNVEQSNLVMTAADIHASLARDENQSVSEMNIRDSERTVMEDANNPTIRNECREEDLEGAEGNTGIDNSKFNSITENERESTDTLPEEDRSLPDISVSATVILRQRSQSSSSVSSSDEELPDSVSSSSDDCRQDPPGQEASPGTEEQTNSITPASPRRLRWYVVQVQENINDSNTLTAEAPPPYDAIYRNEFSRGRPFHPPTYEEACGTSQT